MPGRQSRSPVRRRHHRRQRHADQGRPRTRPHHRRLRAERGKIDDSASGRRSQTITVTLRKCPTSSRPNADTGNSRADQRHAASRPGGRSGARITGAGAEGVVVTAVEPDGPAAARFNDRRRHSRRQRQVGRQCRRRAQGAGRCQGPRQASGADAREAGRRHALRRAAARRCLSAAFGNGCVTSKVDPAGAVRPPSASVDRPT